MNLQFEARITLLAFLCDFVLTRKDVRRPPSITREPYAEMLIEGYLHLEMDCIAEGTPRVTYVWKKNGVDLNLNLSRITQSEQGITINPVSAADNGFYQCFASNQYGTALSTVSLVQVLIPNSNPVIHDMTVAEGRPFVIPADRLGSLQWQRHVWEIAESDEDNHPMKLNQSRRMNFAFNGNLYFSHAVKEDEIGGKLYRSRVYNHYTYFYDRKYTRLTVINDSESLSEFPPTIIYFSKSQDSALIGSSMTLKCFFSGMPLPDITWSRPGNRSLSSGRSSILYFGTELTISNITESDEGEYVCTATNAIGTTQQTLNFSVIGAKPMLNQDGLRDVNVTEGESVTFNCSAFAKPEAAVAWFRNGRPIDVENPPSRFVFSNDLKSLTIANVCRDCDDRETKTDLMVIQCNASNVHGYAFAQGYLNVLLKTKVTIFGQKKASVDFLDERHLQYQCLENSDPSTTTTVIWYKTEPYDVLVRDELPYVSVIERILTVTFHPNCSSVCTKYLGEYKCIGDNGYSRDFRTIAIVYQLKSTTGAVIQNEEPMAVWKMFLCIGVFGLVLLVIGMYFSSKRRVDTSTQQSKDRTLPKRPKMRDPVEHPAGSINDYEGSLPRPLSIYDQIGYETIDQLLGEIGNRGGTIPKTANSSPVLVYNRYEPIDVPEREVEGRGRPMLDEDTTYDEMGIPISLEDVTNCDRMNPNKGNGYESVHSEDRGLPNSNSQFKAINTYTDLKPTEVNSGLNLNQTDVYPHLEISSEEMNPSSEMSGKDVVLYKNMGKADVHDTLYLTSSQIVPCKADYLVLEN